jgi:hypothetical protein
MVNLVSESSKNTRQAHNLFIASKGLPMLSRPILLLYVFEILANVLSLLTFKTKKRNGNCYHGLTYFKGKPIEVNPEDYFNGFMIVIVLTCQYIYNKLCL